jgi:hypothetical protein
MIGTLVTRARGYVALVPVLAALSCAHDAPPVAAPAPTGEPMGGGTALLLEELSTRAPDEAPTPPPAPRYTVAAGRFYGGLMPCPTPPDVNDPACWATMACPEPPDARIKRCRLVVGDVARPDPVVGRIVTSVVVDSYQVIAIAAGSQQGIKIDWVATVLRGDTDVPLPGGEIEVVRIEKQLVVGRSRLTTAQLAANPRVRFRAR